MGSDGALIHQQRRLTRQQFAHAFNYFYGEQLPGRPDQRVNEPTKLQNFVIGSRRVVGMTVYHYAKMLDGKAVDTIGKQTNGLCTSIQLIEQQTEAGVVIPVGAMSFRVQHATAVAHQFQNGRVNLWDDPREIEFFDILDNDAAVGGLTTLYLRTPVKVEHPAARDTSICPSIYSAVIWPGDLGAGIVAPFVGVPNLMVPAGYYFWLPTWGLVQLGQGEELNSIGGPDVYFNPATGFVHKAGTVFAANNSWQRAGYMAMALDTGIPDKDCDVWLQLDP